MKTRKPYILTHEQALAYGGEVLALDPAALGRAFMPVEPPLAAGDAPAAPSIVAVLRISGALCQRGFEGFCGYIDGYDTITAKFLDAIDHAQVGAVVLVIDSPGGDVAGLFEAVRRMKSAQVRTGKPVFAFADELIASAAYAIATVANGGIYLPLSAEVGSVGVVNIHVDATAANEKDGFKYTIIRSGSRKFEGSPIEPLGDVTRIAMQQRVDELAAHFFDLVAASRGLTVEQVRALEGACFSGQAAVQVGLANGIASLEDVLTMAAQAVEGVPMTQEEKEKMERLEKENEELKAKLAAEEAEDEETAEGDEEDDTSDGETDEEAPADDDEEEDAPAAGKKKATGEVGKLKAELAKRDLKDKARDVVDAAGRAGKVPPSERAALIEHGVEHGIASLKAVIALLPVRKPTRKGGGGGGPPAGGAGAVALTPTEQAVAKSMGITEEAFAKSKASLQKDEV